MKTLFKSQDLWDLVEYGFVDVEDLDQEENERLRKTKKKDARALFYIQQVVHETIFSRINCHSKHIKGGVGHFEEGILRNFKGNYCEITNSSSRF